MAIAGGSAAQGSKMTVACVAMAVLGLTTRVARADEDEDERDAANSAHPAAPANHFAMSLGAGYVAQSLYRVSINGAGLEAVFGGNFGNLTVAADIEGTSGSTVYGLATSTFDVGVLVEGDVDRLRIGIGGRLGVLNVDRATSSGSLGGASAGLFLRLTFDVFRFNGERDAIYLAVKGTVDSVGGSGSLYGGVFGAGVRF